MKRLRILGGCLAAALAVGTVTVATAAAAPPEYGHCVAKAKHEGTGYKDSKCEKEGTGKKAKYEWVPGTGTSPYFVWEAKLPYSSEYHHCLKGLGETSLAEQERAEGKISEAEIHEHNAKIEFEGADPEKPGGLSAAECQKVVETTEPGDPAGLEVEPVPTGKHKQVKPELRLGCRKFTAKGKRTTSRSDGDLVVTFTECGNKAGPCTSSGAKEGEIVTSSLDGELGFVERKHKARPGIALRGEGGAPFAVFSCANGSAYVFGSVITEVGGGGAVADEDINFGEKDAVQNYERFIGGPEEVLHTYLNGGITPKKTGLRMSIHQINEKEFGEEATAEVIEINPVA